MSIQSLIEQIGLTDATYQHVSGGDINTSCCIFSGSTKYFLKMNSAPDYPGMFRLEAQGLQALKNNSSFIIPTVFNEGIVANDQFLLLEWLEQETGNNTSFRTAGKKLANLHLNQQDWFGWIENNYIGSLQQINTRHDDWNSFYAECRIKPLVQQLFDKNSISRSDLEAADNFYLRLPEIFPPEAASFLHGDLWSGNYMFTAKGPALFDPAVYFGHREMDIGMTKLFGGFPDEFYEGYQDVYPLIEGWENRLPYAQLYPILVHAVLFGGGYVERSMKIIKMS